MHNPSFRTLIDIEKSDIFFNHHLPVLTFGSCFSSNIGDLILKSGFHGAINPFGVLYNPISIANAINRMIENTPYSPNEIIENNGLWVSLDHHGSYSKSSQDETLQNINNEIETLHQIIKNECVILITLGSSHVYKWTKNNQITGNCHKFPSKYFTKSMLTSEEIIEKLSETIQTIYQQNSATKIIFTISPVRYLSDGFFENQISKSTLHIAIAELQKRHQRISYFPAYEIMMDDLRDYRFYTNDMLHPSPLAIEYIWEHFKNTYLENETQKKIQVITEFEKALNHRPFQEKSATYYNFIEAQLGKIKQFKISNPEINLSELISKFEQKKCL